MLKEAGAMMKALNNEDIAKYGKMVSILSISGIPINVISVLLWIPNRRFKLLSQPHYS